MKLSQLLDKPEKWTKGASARDKSGEVVSPDSPNAICWCLAGAMRRCRLDKDVAINVVRDVIGGSITEFNDGVATFESLTTVINSFERIYYNDLGQTDFSKGRSIIAQGLDTDSKAGS